MNLRKYLKRTVDDETEHAVWQVWEMIASQIEGIQEPDCCPGERNNVLLVWARDGQYLECEVCVSEFRLEWFYKRKGGEFFGACSGCESVPPNMSAKLVEFS
jgi:hypothetical protein